MKRIVVAAVLLASMLVLPSSAFAKKHDYPMRVQVIRSRWHGRHGYYSGFGHANLITQLPGQPPKQGMDFEFSCGNPIRHTFMPDTYPARYGKNHFEIVVLLPELGTDKGSECKMKIEMKDFVYKGGRGGALYSVPLTGGPGVPIQEEGEGPN